MAPRATPRSDLPDALRTGPFDAALRAAVSARGLALHRLRHKLAQRGVHIGVTSLSYWQRGLRRPERPESLRAVRALEEVLELPPRSLVRLLAPPDPAAVRTAPARPYRSLMEQAAAVTSILEELGASSDGGLHTVTHFERVRIGARHELLRRDSQQVLRAHRDGVDRYLAIHHGDPGCDMGRIQVRAAEGCRVGRVRRDQDACVVVAELLFDVRLHDGDTALISYAFEDGSGASTAEWVRGFPFTGGQYVLRVAFDPSALPVRCERFTQSSHSAARHEVSEVLVGRGGAAHIVEETVKPGLVGLAWQWS